MVTARLAGKPGPLSTMDLGTARLEANSGVALVLPSCVVPLENNAMLNPQHPVFSKQLKTVKALPFSFDTRTGKSDHSTLRLANKRQWKSISFVFNMRTLTSFCSHNALSDLLKKRAVKTKECASKHNNLMRYWHVFQSGIWQAAMRRTQHNGV